MITFQLEFVTPQRFAIWSADLYWDQEVTEFYDQDVHSLRGRRHLKRHDHLADVEKRLGAKLAGDSSRMCFFGNQNLDAKICHEIRSLF